MAAPDVSAVVALYNKFSDLVEAGHRARAQTYRERAEAAAQALGAEDCLIVAKLQIENAGEILSDVELMLAEGPRHSALRKTALERFVSATATLQRRRAAGTLMPGSCRAAEVAWKQQTLEHQKKVQPFRTQRLLVEAANIIGFEAFLHASSLAITIIVCMLSASTLADAFPALQAHLLWDLLADTANLLAVPRDGTIATTKEGIFVKKMRAFVDAPQFWLPMDAAQERVFEAWRRLERSGGIPDDIDVLVQGANKIGEAEKRAAVAAAAAPGLRSCGLASCGAREQHPAHFKSCAACRGPAYCCKEHQTEDWPSHKAACKVARKAAAERSG